MYALYVQENWENIEQWTVFEIEDKINQFTGT